MKSFLLMWLLLALLAGANAIERSPHRWIYSKGFPLTYRHTVTAGVTIPFFSLDRASAAKYYSASSEVLVRTPGECEVTFEPSTTINTRNLILNIAMGLGLPVLLALACERLVFRRFRVERSAVGPSAIRR